METLFEWVNSRTVQHRVDKFIVQLEGMFSLLYKRADHVMNFLVEPGGTEKPALMLHVGERPLRWSSHPGEQVSDEAAGDILRHIGAALEFMDISFMEVHPFDEKAAGTEHGS